MLNMHILIALSEIISQCIFLSLSSVRELSKQRRSVGGGAPPGAITSTKLIQSPIANYYQLCCAVTQTESQGHREGHSPSIPSVLPALSKCNRKKNKWNKNQRRGRTEGMVGSCEVVMKSSSLLSLTTWWGKRIRVGERERRKDMKDWYEDGKRGEGVRGERRPGGTGTEGDNGRGNLTFTKKEEKKARRKKLDKEGCQN